MNTSDRVKYLIGYVSLDEFWCNDESDSFEKAKDILNEKRISDKKKDWVIYEKLTIFRKCSNEV